MSDAGLIDLKGVGQKGLIKLNKIGIYSLEDLLFHLPIRYNDKTKFSKISDLEPGKKFLFEGKVDKANVIFFKKRMFVVRISDETASIQLRFFILIKVKLKILLLEKMLDVLVN